MMHLTGFLVVVLCSTLGVDVREPYLRSMFLNTRCGASPTDLQRKVQQGVTTPWSYSAATPVDCRIGERIAPILKLHKTCNEEGGEGVV